MILARAPMRVSFFGGGSDIPAHYQKWGGATLSMGIDKYVYVTIGHTPHNHIKISYAKQEIVANVNDIENSIVRNTLYYFGIKSNIEINSFADVPTMGTGLGGSSAFTCGLVRAIAAYKGIDLNEYETAELACHIEINLCGWNIGKQDQYASAFGGMNYIKYYPLDGYEPTIVQRMNPSNIAESMLLIPTNITRHAAEILDKIDMNDKSTHLIKISKIADDCSIIKPTLDLYAIKLNEAWNIKKQLEGNISNPDIDILYEKCLQNGAKGAKLLGAGGGGYMLALTDDKQRLKNAFDDRVCLDVKIASEGAKVVYRD
jgi:D-glycero-alpha-D-manno-heptose-7-phosphate kinase